MVVTVLNSLAAAVFAFALCYRIDRMRREPFDLQGVAITVAIAALTCAFVFANKHVASGVDSVTFTGLSRVAFYCLIALSVAGLIVTFFFVGPRRGGGQSSRSRRAQGEAVPLVVSVIGLHVAMRFTPVDVRTSGLSGVSARDVGFAVFFIIAGGYLTYGFVACARSVGLYLRMADGPVRIALTLTFAGLAALGASTLLQTLFVIGGLAHLPSPSVVLNIGSVLTALGVALFLIGVAFPMLNGRWVAYRDTRRHRRELEILQPLWEMIGAALPEVILPDDTLRSSTSFRFRRRVVEIRDGLSQMSPLLPEDFDDLDPDDQAIIFDHALGEVEDAGLPTGTVRSVLAPTGPGIDADAAPLLRLSEALVAFRGKESVGVS
ncbi:hypothetical protein GCM10027169_20120 [Gordonia jinhuaensis]|uniref:DUF6545 domain-containing protein n=1 Tax=Gordonia jinhuaensis TaxID=1517702 RepID=A0A916TGK1_9ACTN|nr:MAB_1171c family putative transporter [Gordonia jinhuaensis]GGB44411.1 hypothetical protein GCM10011489_34860 [Gordonia jinhuaensis]